MMRGSDVVEILGLLADAGATAWVDGGWGVDALIGEATREHSDVDLVVLLAEDDLVLGALARAGFVTLLRDWRPTALAVADAGGREVDLHFVTSDGAGGGYQLLPDGDRFHFPAPVAGRIDGRQVLCVDAETQVPCHLGYEATEKDKRDMRMLRKHTGVEIPPELQ